MERGAAIAVPLAFRSAGETRVELVAVDMAAFQAQVLEQPLQLGELGAADGLLVDQAGCVAGHPRLLQGGHKAIVLGRRERSALGNSGQCASRHHGGVVQLPLLRGQGHVQALLDALGQLLPHKTAVAP